MREVTFEYDVLLEVQWAQPIHPCVSYCASHGFHEVLKPGGGEGGHLQVARHVEESGFDPQHLQFKFFK